MRLNLAPPSIAAAVFLAGAATPAAAVGHGGDDGRSTPVACSTTALISAIETANANGGGTLSLSKRCDYQLTDAYDSTADGLPVITKRITIKGNGATIERTGDGPFRIFEVAAPDGDLNAYDLTVKGGSLTTGGLYGAGIYVQRGAKLTLHDSTVTGNTDTTNSGGGIANFGRTTLTHTSVTDNSSNSSGGGIYNVGKLTVNKNSRLNNNQTLVEGGALYLEGGTAALDHTTIDGNSTATTNFGFGGGVAVEEGEVWLDDCAVTNNTATAYGGGVYNEGKVVLRDTRVEGNSTTRTDTGGGGGLYNDAWLEGYKVKVKGNTSARGGGVYTDYGALTLRDSQVTGNTALTEGGGLRSTWVAALTGTTVSGNTVTDASGHGAGIWNSYSLVLNDVRVTGNKATGSASQGGGIYNTTGGSTANSRGNLQLLKTKVTSNSANTTGGVYTDRQFTVFRDSAITNNTPSNCTGSGVSPVYHCTN
ncbi:right-handed parallel beta-helix repeat-containing protein [Streptomyces sp. NPDC059168]|uniref:right-handed parallel beta-helix repeat-containing protein n=1 Tax=Streptomyces sp. NPDC059168 TaxID=3346753 RepID=UPI0036B8E52B